MQLDRTRIVIRPRGTWEILDLALRVTWIYRRPLLVSTLVVGGPLGLANGLLLHWIVADEYTSQSITRYLRLMTLLVFLEAPIATIPTTQVLGRAMFLQDLKWRSIATSIREAVGGLIWTQGVIRGGAVLLVIAIGLRPSLDASRSEVALALLAVYSLLLRATRPFINEIVLLERNPIRRQDQRTITIGRRARSLHSANTGDLIGRWITSAAAATALALSIAATLWFTVGIVTNNWRWGPLMVELIFPATMWLVALYTTVVKFLDYLDLRIRREGWEVDLRVRAAAQELREQMA